MNTAQSHHSEVALLRQQIELQLVAMRRGLSGFASGAARHDFISARMEHIGVCQETLADYLGTTDADALVCNLYNEAMEAPTL